MFDLEKDSKEVIQEVKICFGDLVGKEKDEVYVVLSEPDTFDAIKIKGKTKEELTKVDFLYGYFHDIFPKYLVDHSILKGGNKASNEEVCAFVFRKATIADRLAADYFTQVFLSPQSKREGK